MSHKPTHLLLIPQATWGHVRSCLQIGISLLHLAPNCYLTFLCYSSASPRVHEELSRQHHLTSEKKSRIRTVDIIGEVGEEDDPLRPGLKLRVGFEDVLKGLMKGEKGEEWGYPNLIIYDDYQLWPYSLPKVVRELTDHLNQPYIPCLYLAPVPTSPMMRMTASAEHGGHWDGIMKRYEDARAEGLSINDAGIKALRNAQGKLITPPDLPPMYDYEYYPQNVCMPFPISLLYKWPAMFAARDDSDGYMTFGISELEGWSEGQLKKSLKIPLYPVGPHLDIEIWQANNPKVRTSYTSDERRVVKFLDGMQKEYGSRSACFVSFGSLMWPSTRPELLECLVETLIEAEPPLPFLFAAASALASWPDHLIKKVEESGRGMIVKWAPQLTVLQHESIHFFLTHCGSGSTVEAIQAEIPIVAWPFTGDQVLWAAQLTQMSHCGVRLHQVNSGMKGLQLASGGIVTEDPEDIKREMREAFTAVRGDQWTEMRDEIRKLGTILKDSVERGAARKAREQIVEKYLS
ncbi:hypothetical protein M231_07012 [Tremella mesenterica]|uniref:UDP-glycosyltransferases domain-containing protein n=1 Tax=Tremella mesenterica TaxID=5217 RepID=A0A4Q1BG18_TREME|nr:hypothetical protein M231_07012 [Tremella mesenterica]